MNFERLPRIRLCKIASKYSVLVNLPKNVNKTRTVSKQINFSSPENSKGLIINYYEIPWGFLEVPMPICTMPYIQNSWDLLIKKYVFRIDFISYNSRFGLILIFSLFGRFFPERFWIEIQRWLVQLEKNQLISSNSRWLQKVFSVNWIL